MAHHRLENNNISPSNGDALRRDFRGIFPGIFTMGNIVCGFIAVINVVEGNFVAASWFVILAAFLDALDGKVARLAGSTSRFGVELDSLADFLSFGVAPAALVYTIKLSVMGKWGWVIGVVYIMAASYRLARYNLMVHSEEKKNFLGLPVPGAALTMVAFIIFSFELWGELRYAQYLVSMIILFAALMVSHVEYDALPDRLSKRSDRFKALFLILVIAALIYNPGLALFPMMAIYILSGVLREVARLFSAGVGIVRARGENDRRAELTIDATDRERNESEQE